MVTSNIKENAGGGGHLYKLLPMSRKIHIMEGNKGLFASVAYRYRKSISIIELFVSIISIYIGFLATNF